MQLKEGIIDKMRIEAERIIQRSYSPYSKLKVAAILLSEGGEIYSGVNVENASFPEGVCAETSAISAMVAAGEKQIRAMMILSDLDPKFGPITPCGGCRQRIAEFSANTTDIYVANLNKSAFTHFTMEDLLPHQFHFGK